MMFRRMTRERYLSDAELKGFMAVVRERHHVHQPRDHAFFALLANTGFRPNEVMGLTRGDVRCRARQPWVWIHRPKKKHAADPIQKLPLNPAVARVVARYCDTISDRNQKLFPFTKRQSFRLFRYYAKKAGLPTTMRIYSLRHTVGMRLWRHTHDLRLIQGIMGHVRTKATSAYVHISPEQLRQAHEKIGTTI